MFWKRVLFVCILLFIAQCRELYRSFGLSEKDFNYIVKAHNKMKNQLRSYYQSDCCCSASKMSLYKAVNGFKKRLTYIEEKYLSDVNNVVIGNDNLIKGDDNAVRGDELKVYGDGNYVFHDRFN